MSLTPRNTPIFIDGINLAAIAGWYVLSHRTGTKARAQKCSDSHVWIKGAYP